MRTITLPLESVITIHKDGTSTVRHTKYVTGEIGQEAAELFLALVGSSPQELVEFIDKQNGKAAAV